MGSNKKAHHQEQLGPVGLEPNPVTTGNSDYLNKSPESSGAESGAFSGSSDLAEVIKAWPSLPKSVRAGIVAIVKASGQDEKAGGER